MANTPPFIGYCRVSTADQAGNGHSLAAQARQLRAWAEAQDCGVRIVREDASARTLERPKLRAAMAACERGETAGIVSAKLDRLARSVAGFGDLMTWSERTGSRLVALDLGVDTSTAAGRLVTNVLASVAQWERETIGERTRAGIRQAQRDGKLPGVPDAIVARIQAERQADASFREIARGLERDGIPAARGARWYPATVAKLLARRQGEVQ